MKYCKKCQVSVANPLERCPLCYATLSQKDDSPEFPSYPNLLERAERYNMVIRILLFLSLSASCICLVINFFTFRRVWWSLLVVANIAYMWIAIGTAVRRRRRIGFNILIQAINLGLLLFVLNWFAGPAAHWLIDYTLPFVFFTATLSMTIVVIARRMAIREFILYFVLIALLGFVPLILSLAGVLRVLWPSLVSALYSALSLVSIFIFADHATKIELKKRFHI